MCDWETQLPFPRSAIETDVIRHPASQIVVGGSIISFPHVALHCEKHGKTDAAGGTVVLSVGANPLQSGTARATRVSARAERRHKQTMTARIVVCAGRVFKTLLSPKRAVPGNF
jgi:hypothetical protein